VSDCLLNENIIMTLKLAEFN